MNGAMELLRAAQEGDREACEQAVLENNGLIWSVVRRYYGRGVEPDDLYQLGCLGFLKAIRGFDFSYGTCFSTYAVPKIAGEIRRFLRDDGTIKVGRSIREQALTLYALRERLRQELGREPSLSELSAQTGWTPEEIAQVDLATEAPDSLQRETADGLALEGLLGTEAPEEGLVERIALREAVDQLPEKERMTILLRYFKGLTQERAARVLGADAAGMSTAPEVITAGHCGMRVLGFTLLSNMGAGILDQPLSEQEVLDAAEACKDKFSRLVLACLERI